MMFYLFFRFSDFIFETFKHTDLDHRFFIFSSSYINFVKMFVIYNNILFIYLFIFPIFWFYLWNF